MSEKGGKVQIQGCSACQTQMHAAISVPCSWLLGLTTFHLGPVSSHPLNSSFQSGIYQCQFLRKWVKWCKCQTQMKETALVNVPHCDVKRKIGLNQHKGTVFAVWFSLWRLNSFFNTFWGALVFRFLQAVASGVQLGQSPSLLCWFLLFGRLLQARWHFPVVRKNIPSSEIENIILTLTQVLCFALILHR